jgi:hypothetical protein
MIDKIEREPGNPIALEEVFGTKDHAVGVHYVEDGLADLPYIQVSGPQAERYSALITQGLSVYSEEELFSTWDAAVSSDDKIDAVVRLGVACYDQPLEPYMRRIRQALEDSDPAVRDAGLVAFSYSPWAPMKPLVQMLRAADPDAGVQYRAQLLLEAWEKIPPT